MTHAFRGLGFAASLAVVSALALVPQASAQSTSAHVYVQVGGQAGSVYGYNASSSGQLSPIPGSPFNLGTQIIDSSKSQFITLGHTLLHSYAVASNGAIGSQLSQIPVVDYAGSSCGGSQPMAAGAVLDHTGKYVYVMFDPFGCTAYQSYIISSGGSFTFDGDTEEPQTLSGSDLENYFIGLPSILGKETFAYSSYPNPNMGEKLLGFRRQSSGTLELMQFNETDPSVNGFPDVHDPDASPTGNYIVAQLNPNDNIPTYLASYTVDSQGNLSTTNTLSNMPTSTLINGDFSTPPYSRRSNSTFSPSGNLFVLYGGAGQQGSAENGIEIYNFNGANPLTLRSKLLTGTPINQVAWDSGNHLYAISTAENKLYIFTVTSTSVVQDSTVSIASPYKLVVTSQTATCSAPSTNGVHVCSPAEGATVTSPVQINAAAYISGGIYRFSLWNKDTKLLNEDNGVMDGSVSLAPGTYKLIFDARNTSGTHVYATRDITVK